MIKYHPDKGINPNKRVSGTEAILQRTFVRLRTHQSEWLLNENAGLPWLGWLEQKPPPLAEIKDTLFLELNRVPGIEQVNLITVGRDGTTVEATFLLTLETEDEARFQTQIEDFSNFSFSYVINPR